VAVGYDVDGKNILAVEPHKIGEINLKGSISGFIFPYRHAVAENLARGRNRAEVYGNTAFFNLLRKRKMLAVPGVFVEKITKAVVVRLIRGLMNHIVVRKVHDIPSLIGIAGAYTVVLCSVVVCKGRGTYKHSLCFRLHIRSALIVGFFQWDLPAVKQPVIIKKYFFRHKTSSDIILHIKQSVCATSAVIKAKTAKHRVFDSFPVSGRTEKPFSLFSAPYLS